MARSLTVRLLAVAALVALPGCPRELQAPGPGDGRPCETLEDCNPDATCGDLYLCVDQRCEETPSLVRPCR